MVYLLHFDRPYKHARHYLGYARNLQLRLARHDEGRGARLMAALAREGITYRVARQWKGREADRNFERRLHARNNNNVALCPVCKAIEKSTGWPDPCHLDPKVHTDMMDAMRLGQPFEGEGVVERCYVHETPIWVRAGCAS